MYDNETQLNIKIKYFLWFFNRLSFRVGTVKIEHSRKLMNASCYYLIMIETANSLMNKLLLILIIFLLPLYLSAQTCDCLTQFTFVQRHYENNNPAFQKIKNDIKANRQYRAEVSELTKQIKKETSAGRCYVSLEKYVTLLKDHHTGIDINLKRLPIDFNSPK